MFFKSIVPICIVTLLCMAEPVSMAVAGKVLQTMAAPESGGDHEKNRREQVEQIVHDKLGYYAALYPETGFVILDEAGDAASNMSILAKILGEDPDPLDYEHPEHLRYELLMATLMRIELLLQANIGSATMFKPGTGALAKRKQVCVITMNPWQIAADNRAATRHLLDITDKEFAAIPPTHYLGHATHLRFAIDHEVYHCLDTIYHGPVPMSHHKYWGEYYMLKEESAADAFGLIMHLAAHRSLTPYARTLRCIRGLTLLAGDLNHYTYQSLGLVLQQDPEKLAGMDVQARIRLASHISSQVMGSYEDYLRYAQAACYAMKQFGEDCHEDNIRKGPVDEALAHTLISDTRNCYHAIVGHDLPKKH